MITKHLVVSTYNCDPGYLLKLGIPYTIYDQSDRPDEAVRISKYQNVKVTPNVGHSLNNIFDYIIENYETLPDIIIFTKANVVPRHTTKEYFDTNIHNNYFTNLYHEVSPRISPPYSDYLFPGNFLELNDSWYAQSKDHRLFCNFDDFFNFLFQQEFTPRYLVFSPGACFIVESFRIKNYPPTFWRALRDIASYQHFPAEAYMVERVLGMVLSSKMKLQPWAEDPEQYELMLKNLFDTSISHSCEPTLKDRIIKRLRAKKI
jgi:hypothetical protein